MLIDCHCHQRVTHVYTTSILVNGTDEEAQTNGRARTPTDGQRRKKKQKKKTTKLCRHTNGGRQRVCSVPHSVSLVLFCFCFSDAVADSFRDKFVFSLCKFLNVTLWLRLLPVGIDTSTLTFRSHHHHAAQRQEQGCLGNDVRRQQRSSQGTHGDPRVWL